MYDMRFNAFFFAAFLALAVSASTAEAQKTVYFEDDLASGFGPSWNLEESTEIDAAGAPAYLVQFSQPAMMAAGWIYDASGNLIGDNYGRPVATTSLDGIYTLLAVPFKLDSNVLNVVSFDYIIMAKYASPDRSFGLMTRIDGGQWDTIWRMWEVGESMPEDAEGSSYVFLPDSCQGKNVELGFFFETKATDKEDYYGLFIGNIRFGGYYTTPAMSSSVSLSRFDAENWDGKLSLELRNSGSIAIGEASYAYSFNAGEPVGLGNLLEDSLMIGRTAEVEISLEGEILDGRNTVDLWPVSLNGEDSLGRVDTMQWVFVNDLESAPAYVPVMEVFSASWCGPCNTMNLYLNYTLHQLYDTGMITPIKFQQPSDRYAIQAGSDRYMYYYDMTQGYVPAPIYNAEANISDWSGSYWGMMGRLEEEAAEANTHKALAKIEYANVELDSTAGTLKFDVNVSAVAGFTANLLPFVTEGTVSKLKGSNGETEFHWVALAAVEGSYGKEVSFMGDSMMTFSYEVDMSQTLVEEYADLEIVCFIQNRETREIYQSSAHDIVKTPMNLEKPAEPVDPSANEEDAMPSVKLYPNPAVDNAYVSGLEKAAVQVFDLTGRLVYEVRDVDNVLELPVRDLEAGTYVVRIAQDGKTAVRKLNVLK